MIAGLFRRAEKRRRTIRTLHGRIIAAARHPALYGALGTHGSLGVPDTLEGRFEALCLHVILVLRRLGQLPPPAGDVAQDLVDAVFMQLDAALRETGIGDMGIPKRIKRLGASFYARAGAYGAALDAGDCAGLAAALARNVLDRDDQRAAEGLAGYAQACAAALGGQDLDALLAEGPRFPDPAAGPAEEQAGDNR